MKRKFLYFLTVLIMIACSKDDEKQSNNPNLPNPAINLNLNLNLPEYNPLKFPGEKIIITSAGIGIKGIVIYNVNNELYTAFELSDPNHPPSNCSRMTVEGVIASCPCENDTNEYDIVTGQHTEDAGKYPMQQYRAERNGDNLRISN